MKWTWFALQFIWTFAKLFGLIIVVGSIVLFPIAAALASLTIVYLAAAGHIPMKVAMVSLAAIFLAQGVWALRWG